MNLNRSFVVDAPIDRVAEALCSAPFNEEAERERPEVLSSSYQPINQNDRQIDFELRTTEYRRTKMGKIDKGGTVESVTRHSYNRDKKELRWSYQGVGSRWVTVSGVYRLSPRADATQVNHDIQIEVHIPLIGRQVAKIVAKEFDKAAERFERLLKKHSR